MAFLRAWVSGYWAPRRFADYVQRGRAPQWGLWAVLLRSALDALGLYLPMALLGRIPPTPSYITFLPEAKYYFALVWLVPVIFLMQWLLGGAVMHLVFRLAGRRSDFDAILTLTAMASLVVGAFLLLWDWLWFAVGGMDQMSLGISHLVIDLWWYTLVVAGLRRWSGVPVVLGILATVLGFVAVFPLSVIVMRSPF